MFNNKSKKTMEKEIKEQIQMLETKIDKIYVCVRETQRAIENIAANNIGANSDKSESENDYNKIFTAEEFNKLSNERKQSLELFFSCTDMTPEHYKIMERWDDTTKKLVFDKTLEAYMKNIFKKRNEPQSR